MFAPKNKPDLGMPGPLDGPPKPKAPPTPQHEADESPDEEGQEEQGSDLLTDMMAPLIQLGFPQDQAKQTLAAMLSAAAKCLGGGEPEAQPEEAEPTEEPEPGQ